MLHGPIVVRGMPISNNRFRHMCFVVVRLEIFQTNKHGSDELGIRIE